MRKRGVPFGVLWGILIFAAYYYAFLGFGVYFVWDVGWPHDLLEWLKLLGSSIGYLILGIIGAVPIFLISIYFMIRDRNIGQNWPIIFAFVYWVLPDPLPGPIDDAVVFGISMALRVWFYYKTKNSFPISDKEFSSLLKYQRQIEE